MYGTVCAHVRKPPTTTMRIKKKKKKIIQRRSIIIDRRLDEINRGIYADVLLSIGRYSRTT